MTLTTQQVAEKLVAYCRNDEHAKAYTELYSDDIISIEPDGLPMNRVEGREALKVKVENREKGFSQMEITEQYIHDPLVSKDHFCVSMGFEATTPNGTMSMHELCVYEVKDGKIVKEQFFYDSTGMWWGEDC